MNAQSRAIEESFLRYGIRYQLVGGTRFYARREVKDALAYLRVLRSDTDSVSFERIINVPARAIGDKTIEALRAVARRDEVSTWEAIERAARGEVEGLGAASADLAGRTSRPSSGGSGPGSASCHCPSCSTTSSRPRATGRCWPTAPRKARSAGRTSSSCARSRPATTTSSPEDALDRLLEETALVADQDTYEGDADAVTLITLHAAKGLEFPVVFIAGLEEGLFPHSRALDDEKELEEERRLAYVGITRAKQRLFLSHAWRRSTWGHGPGLGPVAVPARDPGRADDRAGLLAGGRGRDPARRRPGPRVRRRAGRPASGRRSGRAAAAFRPGSGRPGAPQAGEAFRPIARPRGQAGRVRGRGAVRLARRPPTSAAADGRRRPRPSVRPGRSSPASASSATATASATPAGATGSS